MFHYAMPHVMQNASLSYADKLGQGNDFLAKDSWGKKDLGTATLKRAGAHNGMLYSGSKESQMRRFVCYIRTVLSVGN